MDFASLMSQAISKSQPTPTTTSSTSKYLKRSDLESARQAAYLAEQEALAKQREERASAKRKRDEDEEEAQRVRLQKRRVLVEQSKVKAREKEEEEERDRRRRLGLPEKVEMGEEEADEDDIPDEELAELLRQKGLPVRIFGETHRQALRRYRKTAIVMSDGPIPTSLVLVEEKDMKVDKVPTDKKERQSLFRQLASYFTMVIKEWETALEKEKRDTFASKQAYNAMVQSKVNMTPLFRKFETDDLPPSLLDPIVEIVSAAQSRRYVDANDGYLRLSIGKAAWPIGVTMVGIHERSAREKLHETDKGHVMGDEVTRKFLQSMKRCLSFAQVRWPPGDVRQLMG